MDSYFNRAIKRSFDFLSSLAGIVLISPFLIIISIIIKIDSKGKVFFTQERIGKNGKKFTLLKFRTMKEKVGKEYKNHITISGDKRITRFGKTLRRWKLDELPSLFNVLIGDMSLVGPRPDVPGYADKLNKKEKKITSIRPGITGPASLEYANEEYLLSKVKSPKRYNDKVIYPNKIKINLHYIENWSFFLDLKLILKTIFRKDY